VGGGEGLLGPVSWVRSGLDISVMVWRGAVQRRKRITHGEEREALETLAWDDGY